MPLIVYIQTDGAERRVEVPVGANVMRTALNSDISGIVAECGGAAMCATCHVYIEPEFLDRLPPINEVEAEMLESTAAERLPNSRLSCQLFMTTGVDELRVRIPGEQQ